MNRLELPTKTKSLRAAVTPVVPPVVPPATKTKSMRAAVTPRYILWLSRVVFAFILVLPLILIFTPWVQTVNGTGRAIAFNPIYRLQFVSSPIAGRVNRVLVSEGDHVKTGQRILELVDNDPNLELRLLEMEAAVVNRVAAAAGRVREIDSRIENLRISQKVSLDIAKTFITIQQERLQAFRQELISQNATLEQSEFAATRAEELFKEKVGSRAELEIANRNFVAAKANVKASIARVSLGEQEVKAAQDTTKRVQADTDASINSESAVRRMADAEVAAADRDLLNMQVQIARQRAQYVDSPCDGTIFRVLANAEQGGIFVSNGTPLATIVPDIKPSDVTSNVPVTAAVGGAIGWQYSTLTPDSRPGIVAELMIDGNDLPLIINGDLVRLQFEGWPAVQFVAYPDAAAGTFGGRVYLVDPTANERGQFRILVEPDPAERPWPNIDLLRQGVRAQGWVILQKVTLGWELWRVLNGFPPVRPLDTLKKPSVLGPVR